MHRDRQQQAAFNSRRDPARQEWRRSTDGEHQIEAPEHARAPLATERKRHAVRDDDARHRIREPGARR